jgi:DNA-binding response OmpR family regulator
MSDDPCLQRERRPAGSTVETPLPERWRERPTENGVLQPGGKEHDMARILVVDDDELVRQTLTTALTRAGFEVVEARDGDDGLLRFAGAGIDLVILDIIMPNKEGIETLIALRKADPGVKVIAISGGGRTRNFDLLDLARRFGASLVLAKPIRPSHLVEKVREILEAPSSDGAA